MRPRALRDGFLVQSVGDQLVVFDQVRQRLHVLSRTTAVVWRHCDGRHTVPELVALVGRELAAPADDSVVELALAQLDEARLLEGRLLGTSEADALSRRQMLHYAAALAVGALVPTITSCGSPLAPDGAAGTAGVRVAGPLLSEVVTTTTTGAPTTTTTSTTATGAPTTTSTTSTAPPTTTSTTSTAPPTTTSTTSTAPPTTTTTSTTTTSTTTTTPAPRKVLMCQQGMTIEVDGHAVPGLLRAGATLGPCPQ